MFKALWQSLTGQNRYRTHMPRQRTNIRQRSLLRGIVYFEKNPLAAECIVRDLSGSGARLAFADPPMTAAERLELHVPGKGERHRCQIVWRSETEFGVAFVDAPSAHELESMADRMHRLEAELASLKQTVRALQRVDRASSAV